jgi:hypothetical protein
VITFFEHFWARMWTRDALLGDRITGVVFIILVLSVLAMLGGLVADVFVRRRRQHAAKERRAGEADEDLGPVLAFFSPLCANLPISTGASIIFFLLLGLLALDQPMRWAGAAAAVPALLVLLQYVYLWAHKPASAGAADDTVPLKWQDERARRAVESSYGPRTLFIRYGFPAIVLLVECLVLGFVLVNDDAFLELKWEVVYGAQFGAVGAYAWVVIELGRRSFRRDVTSGIALWSVVTLAIGPMLAGALSLIWKPTPHQGDAWQHAVVFFYAGYAPRRVLAAITSAATKLLGDGPAPSVETRSTPLTKIRGITPQIEERLAEEGVYNVENLATVEPIRLLRDTPYDLRTILWWVDEAILMRYVPQRWEMLEERGITGAIDIADLAAAAEIKDGVATEAAARAEVVMKQLADYVKIEVETFRDLAQRVRTDYQVTYIWWLYNTYMTDGENRSGDSKSPPTNEGATIRQRREKARDLGKPEDDNSNE